MNLILLEREEVGRPLPYADRRARHVREVLRAAPGDTLAVGVVEGPRGEATLLDHTPATGLVLGDLQVHAEGPDGTTPDHLHPITLLLGHVRPIVMKRLLKDLTTLGLARVIVFPGELGEKSYLSSTMWRDGTVRRQLVDGASQAGVTCLPTVVREHALGRALQRLEESFSPGAQAVRLLCTTRGSAARHVAPQLARGDHVVVAVGPERGFTDGEERQLAEAGFTSMTLGDRILRTETAALLATGTAIRTLHVT